MDFTNIDVLKIFSLILALIVAIVGHEFMHGWVAYKFGDDTAKNLGRLSINPIRHIDPIGTFIVPFALYISTGFVFGWAKPVPVNMRTVIENGGYKGGIFVALAGIFYNVFIAILSLFLIKNFGMGFGDEVNEVLKMLFIVNLFLGLFNLYPLPPLDGFKALGYLLCVLNLTPIAAKMFKYEKYGLVVLIILLISPLSSIVFTPIYSIFKLFLAM
ncbi:MAG: site-2 protease family protein [Campylobacter sp.]|nr:site-2 protease family protein [Campylobacter sp.]